MHGVPNYFGPQRFGREGFNLDRVQAGCRADSAPSGRAERGFALSAARSLIFNAVLARRVQIGRLVAARAGRPRESRRQRQSFPGRCRGRRTVAAPGRRSTFTRRDRCGGGASPRRKARLARVELAVARHSRQSPICSSPRVSTQERRSLRCAVRDLVVEAEAGTMTLELHARAEGSSPPRCCAKYANSAPGPALESDEDW